MKIKHIIVAAIILFSLNSFGQKQITKSGVIDIFSQTPAFTIKGSNKKVASVLNTETGEVVASTLVRSFKFAEALVEEHFNENYMESHKFPKAVFKGKITNFKSIDLKKEGTYDIAIEGKLTLHGQTQYIKEKGKLTIKAGKISAKTTFNVSLAAYKVEVEKAYKHAIKDAIELKISFNYTPYKKK